MNVRRTEIFVSRFVPTPTALILVHVLKDMPSEQITEVAQVSHFMFSLLKCIIRA